MKKIFTLLFVAIAFTACDREEWLKSGDYFFLDHKGAKMPVWVNGNIESGVFIVTNHGGPMDNSGHDFRTSVPFLELEKEYAVVYWDQRMSGMSQGDIDIETLSVEQIIEDLHQLTTIINKQYKPKSMFLMGHSWGGVLTGGYLGTKDYQDNYNGWIDVAGSIQDEFETVAKKQYIMDRIDSFQMTGDDPDFWQYILDWYNANPSPVDSDWEPYTYVGAMSGYVYDYDQYIDSTNIPYSELIFGSPYSLAFYWGQPYQAEVNSWIDNYDVIEEVKRISIPSLLVFGEDDGAVPLPVAGLTYSLLATDSLDKHLEIYSKCGHGPHNEYPYTFYNHISSFIERYK
ncbi:MAG: alpha/beta hydrolase [Bacteroidia bacterium]